MSTPRDPDEQHGDRLREVLRAEGNRVVPGGDGLMRIQERVGARRARNRWLVPLGAAAGVAVVAGGVVGGLALTGNNDKAHVLPPAASISPTINPTPSPTAASNGTPSTSTVPVYYLRDSGTAIRLYREFHRVSTTESAAFAAVNEMLRTPATDHDYTSLWPANSRLRLLSFSADHSAAHVDLSKEANGPFNGGTEAAQMTIQQLVWTLTAADNAVKHIEITVDGKKVQTLFGVDVSKPQKRGVSYTVLGAVWILSPTQGASVKSPVKISGQATVFEATVSIEILRAGKVIKATTAQATTGGPGRGDWNLTVLLTPGNYVVRAYESSAKDGSVTNLDDKAFTVH
jgi:hypothetical protein